MKPHFEDWARFHLDNPQVYNELVSMARSAKARGATKLGMKQLFEVLRWDTSMRTETWDFKLNNNYTAFYARLIMDDEPDLAGIFEIRS